MKRSPKTELFEDGLQSGTFRKRRFPVLVWTRIFLKTDKKSCVFKRKRIRVDKPKLLGLYLCARSVFKFIYYLQIRDAMQCMQDRKNIGKVLLSPLKEPPKPEPPKPEKQEEKKEVEKEKNETKEETKDKVCLKF